MTMVCCISKSCLRHVVWNFNKISCLPKHPLKLTLHRHCHPEMPDFQLDQTVQTSRKKNKPSQAPNACRQQRNSIHRFCLPVIHSPVIKIKKDENVGLPCVQRCDMYKQELLQNMYPGGMNWYPTKTNSENNWAIWPALSGERHISESNGKDAA